MQLKYPHLFKAFYGAAWAIWPPKLHEIRAFLEFKARGGEVSDEDIQLIMGSRRPDGAQMVGRVACVNVFGTICHRAGLLDEASGGVGTERLGATIDALAADKQIRCICMVFDSPGGAIAGVPELAAKIAGYRGQKKIVALADAMCASAAYYLASQCAEVACVPSGQVGSIGVISAHEDYSKYLDEAGIKMSLIYAGKFKAEGNPYESLGEEARAEIQGKVDHYYGEFLQAVAQGRGTTVTRVKADYGQGRMLTAEDAKRVGMIDRVCTLQELLGKLGAYEDPGARAEEFVPTLEMRRRQLDLEEAA